VEGFEELWLTLIALLVLAVPAGVVSALLWYLLPRSHRGLLRPQQGRAVPWRGIDILFAFGVLLLLPGMVVAVLQPAGFFQSVYGRALGEGDPRAVLWALVVACPIQIMVLLGQLSFLRGARPFQLGLSSHGWPQQVIAGCLSWLVLTPVVLLLFTVLTEWTTPDEHTLVQVVRENPQPVDWLLIVISAIICAPLLEELVFRGVLQPWLTRASWVGHVMVALGALAAAGLLGLGNQERGTRFEPLLFVVAMLPGYWLAPHVLRFLTRPRRPEPVLATVYPADPEQRAGDLPSEVKATDLRFRAGMPDLFSCDPRPDVKEADDRFRAGVPDQHAGDLPPEVKPSDVLFHPGTPDFGQSGLSIRLPPGPERSINATRAIYGTSLLFAAFHSTVWPSPIPLFVLALGLGWLAYRTQSLIGPFVMHGLFNAVSCVVLLIAS
jgi:membrane protease YdiL (CAAX protease family)